MQSGKGLHAYGCALREPLARHVQRADREHALAGESVGVGLGERTDVGEDVELLGRLDGVRVRGLLAGADDLVEDRALALPLHQFDLAAVELEVALEVGDQVLDRAPEVLLRRLRDGVGLVAGQVTDRGLEVLDVLDRDAEADPDLVLGDAAVGGAAVVLAGRPGDARRGVRVAGNLHLAVRAHAGGGRGGLAGAGALGVDRAGRTRPARDERGTGVGEAGATEVGRVGADGPGVAAGDDVLLARDGRDQRHDQHEGDGEGEQGSVAAEEAARRGPEGAGRAVKFHSGGPPGRR